MIFPVSFSVLLILYKEKKVCFPYLFHNQWLHWILLLGVHTAASIWILSTWKSSHPVPLLKTFGWLPNVHRTALEILLLAESAVCDLPHLSGPPPPAFSFKKLESHWAIPCSFLPVLCHLSGMPSPQPLGQLSFQMKSDGLQWLHRPWVIPLSHL